MPAETTRLDLAAARARLAAVRGKAYWRSLDELADTEDFREFLHREFPEKASEWTGDGVSRREFLKVMSASFALAGLAACTRQPTEEIVPYGAHPPEELIPGRPLFYATAVPRNGYAIGVLAESHMGRPTKIEGNPEHPASLGAAGIFAQASLLTLYDPDRSQVVLERRGIQTWGAFLGNLRDRLATQKGKAGSGLRLLTGTATSPALMEQIRAVLKAYPEARWHAHEPVGSDNARAGARLAFDDEVETHYRLDGADVVLSLDSDFLAWGPGSLRYARDFASRRGADRMNRLYVLETSPTITGSMADHRLARRAGEIAAFAAALAGRLGIPADAASASAEGVSDGDGETARWLDAVAADLLSHEGRSLVTAGETLPAPVHLLVHAMNERLGNTGRTVIHTEPVAGGPASHADSLRELVEEMRAGRVDVLLMAGVNPVYAAPADLGFAEALKAVAFSAHLGLYADETARLAAWHVPQAHPLEAWSDGRAYDGTATILQPLIAPLYGGKSVHELLAAVLEDFGRSPREIVRETWMRNGLATEDAWQIALHDGLVKETAFPRKTVRLTREASRFRIPPDPPGRDGLDLTFRPDPTVWDGEWSNNGWLQELPKPLSKLTWDNAAYVAPAAAERFGLDNGDVVRLTAGGLSLEAPVWIQPGQDAGSVTIHLGYGRTAAGRVGTGLGFDAYALRRSGALWSAGGAALETTGRRMKLASTQKHQSMEGRHLVRVGSLEEFEKDPEFVRRYDHGPKGSLYPRVESPGYAWGMSIDLNACIGCNACVVGCQSENNIPVVGKNEVLLGREMHWIRLDTYYAGGLDDPEAYFQPVPCMHRENAPCEVVCPVAATVHSSEGLNDMVYNRCIGTRYCSNNCPYKVRRFNFLQYSDKETPSLKLLNNPNVTVRMRGVMEKCTYCVQRINAARITAKKEDRPIRDGEIRTACQSACPTGAIVFGDIKDEGSEVSRTKADPRSYGILTELNTNPRTTYQARLRNPNAALERASASARGGGHKGAGR
jgi:molybdopterin-containing oxidoreductase family iron-sulfur binding subunit